MDSLRVPYQNLHAFLMITNKSTADKSYVNCSGFSVARSTVFSCKTEVPERSAEAQLQHNELSGHMIQH